MLTRRATLKRNHGTLERAAINLSKVHTKMDKLFLKYLKEKYNKTIEQDQNVNINSNIKDSKEHCSYCHANFTVD